MFFVICGQNKYKFALSPLTKKNFLAKAVLDVYDG